MAHGGGKQRATAGPDDAVYPADPLRLLESVPELELFLSDRRVRGGIERGRPHDVYRALFWARLFGRFSAHRETLAALLADRRLFVAPLRGAPAMFTYNGIGLAVYGASEQRADGAYIGTHYVVLVFVPVFPLGSYLMAHSGANAYRFFGKAPFGLFDWLFNRLVVLGVVGAVLMGLSSSVISSRYADVHVVNGLPFPVVAELCGTRRDVAPNERTEVTVPVGECRMTAWAATDPSAAPIETTSLRIEPGHDVIAWNVLGMAPVYDEVVVYGTTRAPPEGNLHCGESLIVLDDVDHAFSRPPTSVSVSRRSGSATRTHVDVAEPGTIDCLGEVLAEGAPGSAERQRMLAAVPVLARSVGHEPALAIDLARQLELVLENEAALSLVRDAIAVHPESLDLHVEYQNLMLLLGRRATALADYRARTATADGADAHYLAERLDVAPGGVDRWLALHARFPEHAHIHAAVAHSLCEALRAEEGAQAFDELGAAHPELAEERVTSRAECLFAAGRGHEARALVEASFHRAEAGVRQLLLAVLHHDLSAALDPPVSSALFSGLPPDQHTLFDPLYRALTRQPVAGETGDEALDALAAMLGAARTNPARATHLWSRLTGWVRLLVPVELLVMLLGESPSALGLLSPLGPEVTEAVLELVLDGIETEVMADQARGVRAAAWLARSRQPELSPDERDAARTRAHELTTIPTWIRAAEESWPQP